MTDKLERLVAAGIQLLPTVEIANHYVFERDGFVALVERRGEGFGGIGSAGLLTGKGIAPLVLRGLAPFFVAKGFEQPATPEEVDGIRRFQADLKHALSESTPGM
ncbi:MAG: hypothetical protein ABJF23_09955 [Bryobacteraceae bacterium]